MNNPSFLQTDFSGNPFNLEVYDRSNLPIVRTKFENADGKGVYATPKIEGFQIKDMTVERKKNVLGEKLDTLKFFAQNGPPNLHDNTNVRINLPAGFAFVSEENFRNKKPNCARLMNNSQTSTLKCSFVSSYKDSKNTPAGLITIA
jgi:hypothetical protein